MMTAGVKHTTNQLTAALMSAVAGAWGQLVCCCVLKGFGTYLRHETMAAGF